MAKNNPQRNNGLYKIDTIAHNIAFDAFMSLRTKLNENRSIRKTLTAVIPGRIKKYLRTDLSLFPVNLAIEGANVCNARCSICAYTRMKRQKGQMDLALFKKIIDECSSWPRKPRSVSLYMDGEPLLDTLLIERIRYAKSMGMPEVFIATNASLLNKEMSVDILNSGLDYIIMDLDGATKENYEKVRNGLNFETVCANVRSFLELKQKLRFRKPRAYIRFVITRDNQREIELFRRTWKYLSDGIHFRSSHAWTGLMDENQVLNPWRNIWAHDANVPPCISLFRDFVVYWDGRVPICCYDHECQEQAGDVGKQSISEIWNGQRFKYFRQKHIDNKFKDIFRCSTCHNLIDLEHIPIWWSAQQEKL